MGSALAGIGLAMGALSSGAGVISSIQQANAQNAAIDAQNAAYSYQAAVNEQNAELAEDSAKDEMTEGRKDLAKHQLQTSQLLSEQRNNALNSGIAANSDSLIDITNDSLLYSNLDDDSIMSSAKNKADNFYTQAYNYRANAAGQRLAAANNTNKVSAGSAILGGIASGASSTINSYYQYKQAGNL